MRAPLSWLRELVDIPADQSGRDVAAKLIAAGLEVETVESVGAGVDGPLLVGLVLEVEELTEFKKPIRWCQVDVGVAAGGVHGIICGARNFVAGDLVVVALPGTVLPSASVRGVLEAKLYQPLPGAPAKSVTGVATPGCACSTAGSVSSTQASAARTERAAARAMGLCIDDLPLTLRYL